MEVFLNAWEEPLICRGLWRGQALIIPHYVLMVPPENICALWKSYPTVGSEMFVFNDENLWNISNLRILRLSVFFLSSNDKLEKKLPPFPSPLSLEKSKTQREDVCSQSSLS